MVFHYSKHFAVQYLGSRIDSKYTIADGNITNVYLRLLEYINIIHESREESNSVHEYRSVINNTNYLTSMANNVTLLKTLRDQYLHWSVNLGPDGTGMGPSSKTPVSFDKRKRYIIPG